MPEPTQEDIELAELVANYPLVMAAPRQMYLDLGRTLEDSRESLAGQLRAFADELEASGIPQGRIAVQFHSSKVWLYQTPEVP